MIEQLLGGPSVFLLVPMGVMGPVCFGAGLAETGNEALLGQVRDALRFNHGSQAGVESGSDANDRQRDEVESVALRPAFELIKAEAREADGLGIDWWQVGTLDEHLAELIDKG